MQPTRQHSQHVSVSTRLPPVCFPSTSTRNFNNIFPCTPRISSHTIPPKSQLVHLVITECWNMGDAQVSWNSLPTFLSRPLGRSCHYLELILVVFICPLSGIGNRFALPIVKATGRLRAINPQPHRSDMPPTYPGYTFLIPKHCSDILQPHTRHFFPRHGVKAARGCQVLY